MNNMINSFFEANIALATFYFLYFIWIKRDGNIGYQRFFLLFAIVASIVLSIINFNYAATGNASTAAVMLDTITVNVQEAKHNLFGFDFSNALIIGYLSVCIFLIINFLVKLFIVILAIQKIKSCTAIHNGVYYYNGKMAFSFFKFIALPQQLADTDDAKTIATHERTHSRQWHTLDIILADILCAVFWINPVAWMYRKSLKETHEYLADAAVKEQYCDIGRYQMLLLNNAVGPQMGLANCFNQSLTLKRLIMLTQKSTTKFTRIKIFIILPVTALLLLVLACNKQAESKNDNQTQSLQMADENKVEADKNAKEIQNDAEAILKKEQFETQFQEIDEQPSFPGGQSAMTTFLLENIKYPDAAKEKGIQGKVFVQFVVTEKGKIENVKVAQAVNELLDAEAIRVVSAMPDWIPAKSKGKAVKVNYNLPIKFVLGDKK